MILNKLLLVYYTIQQAKIKSIQYVFLFDDRGKLFRKMIFEKRGNLHEKRFLR